MEVLFYSTRLILMELSVFRYSNYFLNMNTSVEEFLKVYCGIQGPAENLGTTSILHWCIFIPRFSGQEMINIKFNQWIKQPVTQKTDGRSGPNEKINKKLKTDTASICFYNSFFPTNINGAALPWTEYIIFKVEK